MYPRFVPSEEDTLLVKVNAIAEPMTIEEFLELPVPKGKPQYQYLFNLCLFASRPEKRSKLPDDLDDDIRDSPLLKSLWEKCQPHQKRSIIKVIKEQNGRSIVALDMGLGKTFLSIFICLYYGGKVLIISPAGVPMVQFVEQFKYWSNNTVSIGQIKHSKKKINFDDHQVWIVSTDLGKLMDGVFDQVKWQTIIVDEAHSLKGEDSIRSDKWIPLIQKHCQTCLLLTGTPQDSKTSDLYNLLWAVQPRLFPSRDMFMERYCILKEMEVRLGFKKIKTIKEVGCKLSEELYLVLRQFMVRETTASAGQAPTGQSNELRRRILPIQLPLGVPLKNTSGIPYNEFWQKSDMAKMPYAWPIIKEEIDHTKNGKVVIYCYHLAVAKYLMEQLNQAGIPHCYIDGNILVKQRKEMTKSLANADDLTYKVGLLTLGSSSTAIHLAPGVVKEIFAQMYYSPAMMKQAEKRAARLGQLVPVETIWLVAKGTVDETMIKNLNRKLKMFSDHIDGGRETLVLR